MVKREESLHCRSANGLARASLPDPAVNTWESRACPSALATQMSKCAYILLNLADVVRKSRYHDPLR